MRSIEQLIPACLRQWIVVRPLMDGRLEASDFTAREPPMPAIGDGRAPVRVKLINMHCAEGDLSRQLRMDPLRANSCVVHGFEHLPEAIPDLCRNWRAAKLQIAFEPGRRS